MVSANDMLAALDDAMFDGPCRQPLPHDQAARLREHIWNLASVHGITLSEANIPFLTAYGEVDGDKRKIVTPNLGSELAYFVALHEIGHFVLQLPSDEVPADGGPPMRLYVNEAAVWEWAVANSQVPPSADAEQKFLKFLISDDPGPGRAEAIDRVSRSCVARRAQPVDPPE